MVYEENGDNNRSHWDSFYYQHEVPRVPSQFSVFTCVEFPDADFIIEIGCGNGRDFEFFASRYKYAIGVDESSQAISNLKRQLPINLRDQLINSRISSDTLKEQVKQKLDQLPIEANGLIYARFFLHAIKEEDESAFWQFCKHTSDWRATSIAIEFRSSRDEHLIKTTPDHYRRYIYPPHLIARAASFGFTVLYFVEGFGFAKYREDDAYVARMILTRKY